MGETIRTESEVARDVARRLQGLPVPDSAMEFSKMLEELLNDMPPAERIRYALKFAELKQIYQTHREEDHE